MFDSIDKALERLKQGKLVIVCDDEDRENEGDLVGLAEYATTEMINFMITHGKGLVCTPVTTQVAAELELMPMVKNSTDPNQTAFTVSVDYKDTTTGISADERALTIRKLLDTDAQAGDFQRPGHIFPLVAKEGGVLRRAGHTEAAVDLARLSGTKPAGVICEIIKEDGTMARVPDLREMADEFDIPMITIADLIKYRYRNENHVKREVEIQLPTEYGDFRAVAFTNDIDYKDHIALIKGEINPGEPTLVRVHSECLTGDVFGSYRCDCGPQLHNALKQISENGSGILVYMRQEGRGIGLLNKMYAYKLQEEGLDTVEANEKLGFGPDLRDYGVGAQILKNLGISKLKLLTNNPKKISGLGGYDLEVVERVPIQMESRKENENYLKTKQTKLGHLFHY
ncbi:bifunctional 3,4-dihydroxy-2-butanone-4-phosphate synthase/GTP cyclohydrolase II [Halobacillus salinarum]|uniref:Riboflavin biosynthesis protein RibBA n=1 Tax=Halobacillus salinarum TaxID=2932257 RepID=A0ABY4ESZ0_9BACI|nr:bifunctional 3,4-dihydroxy-2-butanone-4-phosphate synthase/GTP cyclohydrolase II [Halobacillus salinarum]UOQ45266.1 bifunctional 3,4-dihydroxy-2-butanone-4-phosphate synthase/GTP cyclohydrolase II [Halobacillus salinarum]